jgi:hypothetical protein
MLHGEAFRLVCNRSRTMKDSPEKISPLRRRMIEDMVRRESPRRFTS